MFVYEINSYKKLTNNKTVKTLMLCCFATTNGTSNNVLRKKRWLNTKRQYDTKRNSKN